MQETAYTPISLQTYKELNRRYDELGRDIEQRNTRIKELLEGVRGERARITYLNDERTCLGVVIERSFVEVTPTPQGQVRTVEDNVIPFSTLPQRRTS